MQNGEDTGKAILFPLSPGPSSELQVRKGKKFYSHAFGSVRADRVI